MIPRQDIQEELRQLAPDLARLAPGTPYEVPAGYFEQLSGQVMQRIRAEAAGNPKEEAAVYAPVFHTLHNHSPYKLPAGYFEQLAGQVMQRIRAEAAGNPKEEAAIYAPVFHTLHNHSPYKVPAGYFEKFAEWMLVRIKAEEVASVQEETSLISPLLGKIQKSTPYSVPAGYFDQAPEIPEELPSTAKLVRFPALRVFRYAAAAAIIAVILSVGYFFLNDSTGAGKPLARQTDSTAEQQVIQNIGTISDTEIAGFIDGYPAQPLAELAAAPAEINSEDISLILADVSDQELENYVTLHNQHKENFN